MHGVLIIGGGFAGVWSAAAGVLAAGATDLPITLEFLRVVGVPHVYAAGDTAAATAEDGHPAMQS